MMGEGLGKELSLLFSYCLLAQNKLKYCVMPIYEFICTKCKKHFECLVSIGKENSVSCVSCGSKDIQKMFSSFGIGGGSNRINTSSSSCTTCSATSCDTCK